MELAKYSVFFEVLGNFSVVDAVQNLWMYKLQVEMMVDQSPILHLKEIRSTSHRKSRKSPRLDFFFSPFFLKIKKIAIAAIARNLAQHGSYITHWSPIEAQHIEAYGLCKKQTQPPFWNRKNMSRTNLYPRKTLRMNGMHVGILHNNDTKIISIRIPQTGCFKYVYDIWVNDK